MVQERAVSTVSFGRIGMVSKQARQILHVTLTFLFNLTAVRLAALL